MLVSEKLSTLKSEKVKALGYKQDRKTVCNHFYQAYPMETVFDDTQLTGLYFAQIAEDRYNNGFFGVFNYIGDGIYVDTYFTGCYGNDSVDRLDNGKLENDRLDKCFTELKKYIGRNGFVRMMKIKAEQKAWIRNTEFVALKNIGEIELAKVCSDVKVEIIKEREREQSERRAAYEAKEKEREEKFAAEKAEKEKVAIEKIRTRQKLDNDDGIILDLMRKYNIKVPLRTQGWILDCMVCMYWDGNGNVNYKYYRRKNGRGSQAVFTYMRELIEAVDSEVVT